MEKPKRRPLRPAEGPVRGWTHKGLGRVYLEHKEAELFGVYPGEEVQLWLGRGRNAWLRAVTRPHPERVEERCPHFGVCGGCSMQTLAYPAQLRLKCAPVERSLRALESSCRIDPVCPSPQPFHYRSKVEFSFLGGQLGFHQRGCFDRVVDVQECFLAPGLNPELLARTRAWRDRHGLSGWDVRRREETPLAAPPLTRTPQHVRGLVADSRGEHEGGLPPFAVRPRGERGDLRYLVLRRSAGTGQWLALLVTGPHVAREAVRDWADALAPLGPTGLLWGRQSSTASAVVVDEEELLAGHPEIEERLGELRFRLSWRSFFQSNPPAYQCMLDTARDWLQVQPGQKLLDLYCGIGTIGLSLAPRGAALIGVEAVPAAIADARRSAAENEREGEFHCLAAQDWEDLACDALVLDPPRSGCHPRMLEKVAAAGPARVLYISCNPARFAEEMGVLGAAYRLERAQLFDFFPQTRHVEALVLLVRRD